MRRTISIVTSVLLISVFLPGTSFAANVSALPDGFASTSATAAIGPCMTANELDCIQAVELAGARTPFQQLQFSTRTADMTWTDGLGNVRQESPALYEGAGIALEVNAQIESPRHRLWELPGSPGQYHVGGALVLTAGLPANDFTSRLRISVRTSFLEPQDVSLRAAGASYTKAEIPGGGTLWTFTGSQVLLSGYAFDENSTPESIAAKWDSGLKADWTFPDWNVYVVHYDPSPNSSYFDPTCNGNGAYTVQSNNASGSGVPLWNADSRSLNFNIYAPHLLEDGETLNQGHFYTEAPDSFIDCAWKGALDLFSSGGMIVKVYEKDGTEQPISYTVSHTNGVFKLSVTGFHYSSPTISVSVFACPRTSKTTKFSSCPNSVSAGRTRR